MTGHDICAMCSTPTAADHGLLCPYHRAEDDKIAALRPANRPGVAHVFSVEQGYLRMEGERDGC